MSKTKKSRKKQNKIKSASKNLHLKKQRQEKKIKERMEFNKKYPNGRAIFQMMNELKIKGSVKDYIVISGDSMLDYKSTYSFTYDKGVIGFGDELRIMHKKDMHKVMGKSIAEKFWHPVFGRLVDIKPKS